MPRLFIALVDPTVFGLLSIPLGDCVFGSAPGDSKPVAVLSSKEINAYVVALSLGPLELLAGTPVS